MHANLYYCPNVSIHSIEKLARYNVDAMGEIKEKRTSSAGVIDSYSYYTSYIYQTCTKCHIEVDLLPYN